MQTLSSYWMVSPQQANWSYGEWLDHYEAETGRTYESSVVEATDESCLLEPHDLSKLLQEHGTTAKEYIQAHADAVAEELLVLSPYHAGQVLNWLGY